MDEDEVSAPMATRRCVEGVLLIILFLFMQEEEDEDR